MPIADLHCHYPMHLLAAERKTRPGRTLKAMVKGKKRRRWDKLKAFVLLIAAHKFNFRSFWDTWRVSLEQLEEAEVDLVFSVLYLPDAEMDPGEWPEGSPTDDSFEALVEHLDQVTATLEGDGTPAQLKAVVVKSKADLKPNPNDYLPRFAHCIEGGFHLGSDSGEFDERVKLLSESGVAYITLAHLFWRQVATNAPALPFLSDSRYHWLFPQPENVGLNELGRAAVRAMHRYRVLIDISHMSEAAIDDTFELLDELDDEYGTDSSEFPVIATHAGYRFGNQSYMLSEKTIERIAARDGVIGLIMAHHQLNDGLFSRRGDLKRTLAAMHAHIDAIRGITGSHRHTGIGSDLDGFIKPTVGGIESAADLAKLAHPLRETYSEDAKAVLRGNARRVLRTTLVEPVY
jgi:microsomal dipeptidase-like Zn-dependent dipeptidase